MLEERDQTCSRADHLQRRHVNVLDFLTFELAGFAFMAAEDIAIEQRADFSLRGIGLRNNESLLFVSRQIIDFVGDLGILDLTVRCFDEAVFVDLAEERQ